MSVRFRFDWVDAAPSPDELSCRTMAALSIEADGAVVTSALDRLSGIHRNHVVVPLSGVAEWLVGNWWHLFSEIEDTRERRPGFEYRHDLAFAGDGFVLPSLTMVSGQERMLLRWRRHRPQHARIEFVDEGETDVAREELEAQFRDLIDAVLERLRGGGAAPEMLEREWAAVNALDPDEREFCRAAALLGVDPFDVSDSLADAIATFWETADPSVRDDALAAASATSLSLVSDWLAESLDGLGRAKRGGDWPAIPRELPHASDATSWGQGYDLARSVRRRLDADDGRFDFASTGPLAFPFDETSPPSRRIQGLVAADAPACAIAPRGEQGKRFLLARALGDYLGRSDPGAGLLSSLATHRQARSRAFAAEFLAPATALRERLPGDIVEAERVDDLGREFDVSSEVIRRQIENHRLATIAAW